MEEDFLKLSKMFNAMRSVVRVPALDPKYKIAVLASKQVLLYKKYGFVIEATSTKRNFCSFFWDSSEVNITLHLRMVE
ncbi:hypothetical protein Vadar_016199 [Vaccinium darrowii]|uniref:Uncharacterized protein n=1 Tax=Vaccinium darrowii TaxID=229202 RepID=A0ACB7XA01_9ERIC|nr:hypothetical protein Vadar_016199 [Vaccinium darrowii]